MCEHVIASSYEKEKTIFILPLSYEITWLNNGVQRHSLRIFTYSFSSNTSMAAQQQNRPEFKLVLVGDGGVGMEKKFSVRN